MELARWMIENLITGFGGTTMVLICVGGVSSDDHLGRVGRFLEALPYAMAIAPAYKD